MSVRLFANGNGDKYPAKVSVTNGGLMEIAAIGNAFRHFQVLSNELSTPRVLVCPSDDRKPARNFASLTNTNLSYFINLDADEEYPQTILAGDRFIGTKTLGSPGVLPLTMNAVFFWTKKLHRIGYGNVGLADGSVQSLNGRNLQQAVMHQDIPTNWLAIP